MGIEDAVAQQFPEGDEEWAAAVAESPGIKKEQLDGILKSTGLGTSVPNKKADKVQQLIDHLTV